MITIKVRSHKTVCQFIHLASVSHCSSFVHFSYVDIHTYLVSALRSCAIRSCARVVEYDDALRLAPSKGQCGIIKALL